MLRNCPNDFEDFVNKLNYMYVFVYLFFKRCAYCCYSHGILHHDWLINWLTIQYLSWYIYKIIVIPKCKIDFKMFLINKIAFILYHRCRKMEHLLFIGYFVFVFNLKCWATCCRSALKLSTQVSSSELRQRLLNLNVKSRTLCHWVSQEETLYLR